MDKRKKMELDLDGPTGLVDKLVDRVCLFNQAHEIPNPANMANLLYLVTALNEEAGEVAGAVKKMLRDGVTEELKDNLREEIVDNFIYLAMIIEMIDMDFDQAFYDKEEKIAGKPFLRDGNISRDSVIEDNLKKRWE